MYDKNPNDPIVTRFIKKEGVFFPDENFDSYISLLGGSVADISFVMGVFPDKTLILNETESSLYGVLLSLRDYSNQTIELYRDIVRLSLRVNSEKEACRFYNKVKRAFYGNIGKDRLYKNAALLLFLLHTGESDSILYGNEAKDFYLNKIETLSQWHKVLCLPNVFLFHTNDYSSLPIPSDGRNFIVANTPEYLPQDLCGWSHKQVTEFCKYFVGLSDSTNSFLLASSNTSPVFRNRFRKNAGWFYYNLESNETYSSLYYDPKHHKNNMSRCFVSNYPLKLPVSSLTQENECHTKELLDLYSDYCKGLI